MDKPSKDLNMTCLGSISNFSGYSVGNNEAVSDLGAAASNLKIT